MADQTECAIKSAGGDKVESSEPIAAAEPVVQKPVDDQPAKEVAKDVEEPAPAEEQQSNGEEKKQDEDDKVTPVAEEPPKSSEAQDEKQPQESSQVEQDKVQVASADNTAEPADDKEAPVVAEEANGKSEDHTNGDSKVSEPVVTEENGCQLRKRKGSNAAELVEDDKSPKKAKLVDESDNAKPVEETAA